MNVGGGGNALNVNRIDGTLNMVQAGVLADVMSLETETRDESVLTYTTRETSQNYESAEPLT